MKKNKNLKWFAIRENFSSNKLEYCNVLGGDFVESILKQIKHDKIDNYEKLKNEIRRFLMYRFWSKAEHEVIVRSIVHRPGIDKEFKIDIWYQLEPNLDRITEYIIKELQIKF